MKGDEAFMEAYKYYFHDQISLQDGMSKRLGQKVSEEYRLDVFGIKEPLKILEAMIVTDMGEGKCVLATEGNLDSQEYKIHETIYKNTNDVIPFRGMFKETHYMGFTLILGKDMEDNDKLVAFLNKPCRLDLIKFSDDIRILTKDTFKYFGVDEVYLLIGLKEMLDGTIDPEDGYDYSESITPNYSEIIQNLYTNEVIR